MVTQSPVRHAVHVYETDSYLSERVVELVRAGLAARDRCIVVATSAHRELFSRDLIQAGVDVRDAQASGELVMLDAREILDGVMVGDRPDASRLQSVFGPVIARTAGPGRVRAFGEMVDVLWREGHRDAALELERMWSDLARRNGFDLMCAYMVTSLYRTSADQIAELCDAHDHVATTEIETSSDTTRILLAELARRANVERELREQIRALQRSEEVERTRAARGIKLQQAAMSLASAVQLGELVDTIVSTSVQLTGAVAAVVYLADPDGRYRLCGSHNVPSAAERWPILPLDAPVPLARSLAIGRPLWVENREQLVRLYPTINQAAVAETKTVASASIPLVHDGVVVGGVALSFETSRAFPDEERAWFESFAKQCALAVERVRHFTAERKARSEAENLLRIAASLNETQLDLEAVLQRVTDEATALVGAQLGAFFYNVENDRGEAYKLYTLSGARAERFARFGMPRNTPLFSHTFDGRGTVRLDDVRNDPRYGQMPPHHGIPAGHPPIASYLAVPVRSRTGAVIGGLFFGHEEPGRFTVQHESSMRALAVTAAVAIDNAELYRKAREAEDAQRKTVEQLVDTVRMNELFTGVLAHDLRNPLAAVTTASELLLGKTADGEKRIVERVLASARRMARMIEQLLDFTRIRMGTGLPVDAKPCDLQVLIGHVVDELRAAHPRQPMALEVIGDPHGRWDDDRLAQALSNLIGNAAQHGTPEYGVHVSVDGTHPGLVSVRIHNAGAVPPELLPLIFEPMIGGQRRNDGTRGLGIGLFITREIALSHHGAITVESTPEAGTTFTLSLPREVASVEVTPRELPAAGIPDRSVDGAERMRTLVESVRDHAIFMLDDRGLVQTWSPSAEAITGWSRDDIANRSIEVVYAPASRHVLEIELGRAAKLGESKHEGWYTRRDGAAFWAQVSLSAIRGASGHLVGYAAVMRDLTEQVAARREAEERDALVRLMVDSVRDYAIFRLDADGNVASWNRGAQLTKGYTPGEIIGRHISTFYTREDRDAGFPQMLLARAARDGRVESEGWRIRKDGSRFWADVVITALRDDEGVLRGYAKVTRDLTDRRRADEELRKSEERFRLVVESVRDYAIFVLDPTGHVVTWNPGAERINGYQAHEIVGDHFSRFYEPEEVRAGKCERELEIAVRDGRFEEEGWRVRKDGSRFWANVVITPLRGTKNEVLGFAKITRDLTERRALEDERLRAVQAQEGIRLRDEFLSIVSHELKTPLAGLLLQVEALARRTNLDEGMRSKLLRARESGERLDNLIETLLDVSRIATGRFVLSTERFDLAALLRETTTSFEMSAAKAGSELRLDAPVALVGRWDRVRMSQVVANLLSNALKYGGGRPIELSLARAGNDVELVIRDHGPGVDPMAQRRIFERFERASSTRHYGGFGIGLYVVREIVNAHGGTVRVENAQDGGARFIVRLPMEST